MRRVALVIGLALVPLAGATADTPAPSQPPKPKVTSLGVTRYASVVSSCWSPGGGQLRLCVDGPSNQRPKSTIRWAAGAAIRIDLRLPASVIEVTASRHGPDPRFYGAPVVLKAHRLDASGRFWRVRLPPSKRTWVLLGIFGRFKGHGDLGAILGLRRR